MADVFAVPVSRNALLRLIASLPDPPTPTPRVVGVNEYAQAGHARRLLATSTDRHHRDRVLDALKAWGHDTSRLENASDIAAREGYARLRTARASSDGNWIGGGYSEDPPF